MGMLTLAGVVSGGGKALQQGLQQTQQYMNYSMLQKEREEMERARMDITYGRELGVLQMKHRWDTEAADTAHSRALDLQEQKEDADRQKGRIERQAAREASEAEHARNLERDQRRGEQEISKLVVGKGLEQQENATKTKQEQAEKARERAAKRAEMEHITGREIVTETIRNQRTHGGASSAGDGKWDDTKKARYKQLAAIVADYNEKTALGAKLTDREQKEYDFAKRELNTMTDIPNEPLPGSVDIGKFDKFKGASPY